jgi:prepilin-type N-terminal cleavage/methylation domain-containing protein
MCTNKQSGFSLLEVLISVLILSVGVLALAGFNGNLYKNVRYSNDRAKAMASAQLLIDKARSEDLSKLVSDQDPGSCADSTPHRKWTVTNTASLTNSKDLSIYVCWTDSNGTVQEISLSTQVGVTTIASATTPTPAASTTTPQPSTCSASSYSAGTAYAAGALVKNLGRQYECKPWPYSGWCQFEAYAPGQGASWQDAWVDKGPCT